MVIKSQQDIKNANKAKSEKIPKSMEEVAKDKVVMREITKEVEQNVQPIIPLIQRVEAIEAYLGKVDQAFEKIVVEISNLKNLVQIVQSMDGEISKLTGDIVRISKLEEERYIELATGINHINEKVTTLDEYIPVFVDKRINDYFEAFTAETEVNDQSQVDEQELKE